MSRNRPENSRAGGRGAALTAGLAGLAVCAHAGLEIIPLDSARPWQPVEFRLTGAPAAANPFDPEAIQVNAVFTPPGGDPVRVPAFWFQDYTRRLSGGSEVLTPLGSPEWRLRYTPPRVGVYSVSISVLTNGAASGSPALSQFAVTGDPPARTGFARVAAEGQYFETGDGRALPLIGANVCWHGARGTYDYDDWFGALREAGENYARLWMCPWSFGLETEANSLNRYRLEAAWRLDQVLRLAERCGIYLELCLDYHGMFAVEPDYWGGNNYWSANPYNLANGGPCAAPNDFFTNPAARVLYQKRLRYLAARYGASPNLLGWQFFNEIDNVYSLLNAADVAAWHAAMGDWLRANDPFGHLLTTSFTYAEAHPELWSLPQIDYVCAHAYGPDRPAASLSAMVQSLRKKYGKPVLIDEYGTSWQGWNKAADPYLRGLRQGLWGGALGGSAGTAMPWWWQDLHRDRAYPVFAALGQILGRTGWGRGGWTNLEFRASLTPPALVGEPLANGAPFEITLPLSSGWGILAPGELAVPNPGAANYSARTLNSFVHGSTHAELRTPFRLSAWFTNNARLVMHLNSVSWNSALVVRVDGQQLYRTNLANLDGAYAVTNEYNLDLAVPLPVGRHRVEIVNLGADWFYLDWVRLERVLPAAYLDDWRPSAGAIGRRGAREALLYVVAPGADFPGGATVASLPVETGQSVTLTNCPAGQYHAEWYDPATANPAGRTQAAATNGSLTLPLPDFEVDLAGILYPPPSLTLLGQDASSGFELRLESETGGRYWIETSTNLSVWLPLLRLTNDSGTAWVRDANAPSAPARFYRARQGP